MEIINDIYIKCLKCGKKIYKENKYIHELKCPMKNTTTEEYQCSICGEKIDIKYKVDHLLSHEQDQSLKEPTTNNILNLSFGDNKDDLSSGENSFFQNLSLSDSVESFEDSSDSSLSETYSNDKGLDEETIQKFPIRIIKSIKKFPSNKRKCIICLEKFKKKDNCILLDCKHIYHAECIKTWMRKKGYCPLCKNKIELKDKINDH